MDRVEGEEQRKEKGRGKMSEFITVMRQARRMCAEYSGKSQEEDCSQSCPLYSGWCMGMEEGVCFIPKVEEMEKIEALVTAWAEEHPEPVYPTFYQWVETQMGGDRAKIVDDHDFVKWMDATHISAELAEKLGVKPIDGGPHPGRLGGGDEKCGRIRRG